MKRAHHPPPAQRSMIVAGVMSGTSADGADVALVRISPAAEQHRAPRMKLVGQASFPYSRQLRNAVLAAMDAPAISTADLARLHWRLGEFYGNAVQQAQTQLGIRAALVGMHGQTIYHQGKAAKYLGTPLRCTWQIGESSEVAARTSLPVVSDFRTSDMAYGGQAAPLVPIFDHASFAHAKRNRVLQNLGGIANMTVIAAGSQTLMAFDSGPAGVVIDSCMQALYNRAYDRNGAIARRGSIVQIVLDTMLRNTYFQQQPPKSCGREQFGGSYVSRFIAACKAQHATDADIVATATALTAQSILHAYRSFAWPWLGQRAPLASATDYIVAGGGARNATLMQSLRAGLEPLSVNVSTSEDFGAPTQAKEAMAFALLAWLRWHHLPGNVPAATGAERQVILGKVTLP